MKKLGLALGGGGIKGLAHIGVLQILADNNIKPEFISGTSAGSIIAALYASGMSPYQMEKEVLGLTPNDYIDFNIVGIFKYLMSLLLPAYDYKLNGLIIGNKIEKLIYQLTDGKTLRDVKIPIAIISCDIDTGRKVIFTNKDLRPYDEDTIVIKDALLSEAVRSSISIPVTFEPNVFDGMQMVDGGLMDIVPAQINRQMGAPYVLAINLGQKTYHSKVNGIRQIVSRTLSIMTFETSGTEEEIFANMLIFPGVPNTGLDDIDDAAQIIRIGRRAMKENIQELIYALSRPLVTEAAASTYTIHKVQ